MRRFAFTLVAALWPLLASAEVSVTDDTGATVALKQPARRIVTLAPHLAETLFAAGAGDRLVGTVDYSDYPDAAKKVPRVGGYSRVDLEAVIALKPDLIIAWYSGNAPANVEKLRGFGFPVYVSQPDRIEDVAREIERIGRLAGTSQAADAAAENFRARLDGLRREYEKKARVRTFYQIWKQPLSTVGGRQIISSVIRLCGGENVFGDLQALAPVVSVEAVVSTDPEAIVASGMGEARPEWLDDWKRWPAITAVARNNLFFVPPELIQRHTPRLLDGAEVLCRHLQSARDRRAK
ncbi:cobalamin-binding protein [Propionivibrio sp.]|uniref:cobalamin-binding protein n=1 Tax=Propionivibrio sp. TaxID=2212460 RepID=UPI00272E4DC7|nr:cobalamin-binding protein [Propionivibrio sp.]